MKSKTVLVAGYYGFGNTGDEAILQTLLEGLRFAAPQARAVVVSGDPSSTRRQHGVDAVEWRDVGAIAGAVEDSDLVILGGGGLLQDLWGADPDTLLTPDHYGLSFYAGPAVLAALAAKPLALVGLGVGPLASKRARRMVQGIGEAAAYLSVRDADSRDLLIECGIQPPKIVLSADAAFALAPARISTTDVLREAGVEARRPVVGVALRPWSLDSDPNHWEGEVAGALDRLVEETGGTLILVPFQRSTRTDEDDAGLAERLRERLRSPARAAVPATPLSPPQIAGVLGGCDLVVAMRLHAAVFAIAQGVPLVGIGYDPKLRSLFAEAKLSALLEPLAGISSWSLQARMESALQGTESLRAQLSGIAGELRSRAQGDVISLAALLDRGFALPPLTDATRELLEQAMHSSVKRASRLGSRSASLQVELEQAQTHAGEVTASLSSYASERLRDQRQLEILTRELALARRELGEFQSSRVWRVANLYWRARRFVRRTFGGHPAAPLTERSTPSAGDSVVSKSPGRTEDPQLAHVLERVRESRGVVIFLPSIGWGIHLVQRPHHLARVLARRGFLVIFDCSNSADKVEGFREVEPGLFLFKGRPETLHSLPSPWLWAFPYNVDAAEAFPEGASTIYDWIDDLDVFPYERERLTRNHERALSRAKLVLCVARRLHREALRTRPDALYVPNGVEHQRFLSPAQPPQDDALNRFLAGGGPVAGYYGALARWFDDDLLEETARQNPDWRFVLIGQELDESLAHKPLWKRGNVLWLGPKDYETLPGYLSVFDVATIPFRINPITLSTSPLKLFEYFAGGKPVVTTPMPECEAFPEVEIAQTASEFSAALARAREKGQDPGFRERLRELAAQNSWDARVDTVLAALASGGAKTLTQTRGLPREEGQPGVCNICGQDTQFLGSDPALYRESLNCARCLATSRYRSIARGLLEAFRQLAGVNAASLAQLPRDGVSRRIAVYDTQTPFSTGASAYPIPDLLARCSWIDLHLSTHRPSEEPGKPLAPRTTNQNLERLTFPDASFDVVVTSDVMEHVRLDDLAHKEIRRVLRPGGVYLFTVPHFRTRETLQRVEIVDPSDPSRDRHLLEPEYHGNANSEDGRALAYRGYGTDLDEKLRGLGFSVEYTKQEFPENGIRNTELFFCRVGSG